MTSYWLDTEPTRERPPAPDGLRADTIVIGGGIAGICCAYEIAATGRSVALLEAGRILSGVTGNTTAKLTALHTLIYQSLSPETGRLYAQSQTDAVDHVASQVRGGIECEFERVPAYTYVSSTSTDDIVKEVEAAREAGLDVSYVAESGLPFPITAAIRLGDQAQFHPVRYLRHLAEGLDVYENSRVTEIDGGDVTTAGGSVIHGETVVVATQFPILDKRMMLTPRLSLKRELVLAAPIDPALDPQGMFLTTEENLRSVRSAPYRDGRRLLIVTGETYVPGPEEQVRQRLANLADWASRHFGVNGFRWAWSAHDFRTPDGVPFIGHFPGHDENVFVATGFGGWGMSNGVASGRLIASLIEGRPLPWASIFDPGRFSVKGLVSNLVHTAKHFVGDRAKTRHAEGLEDIAPGEGRVMMVDGDRVAIYHHPEHGLQGVKATCTHMGCVVDFNDVEATWDCPCHGSRFAVDGSVVAGPALTPLEPHKL